MSSFPKTESVSASVFPKGGNAPGKWPKTLPPLTPEQKRINDDFMAYWHEVLPRRYSIADRFNHQYVLRHPSSNFRRALEVGAGLPGELMTNLVKRHQHTKTINRLQYPHWPKKKSPSILPEPGSRNEMKGSGASSAAIR